MSHPNCWDKILDNFKLNEERRFILVLVFSGFGLWSMCTKAEAVQVKEMVGGGCSTNDNQKAKRKRRGQGPEFTPPGHISVGPLVRARPPNRTFIYTHSLMSIAPL